MIRVLFNSQPLDFSLDDIRGLQSLLDDIEKNRLPAHSFIKDVMLDGQSLVAGGQLDIEQVTPERWAAAGELNVISCTVQELAEEAIAGAIQYITGLEKPMSLIAKEFTAGQNDQAQQHLKTLLEGLSSLLSLVGSLESQYQLDYGSIIVCNAPVRTHLEDLRRHLQEFVRAQELRDTVTLADLLEYELKPSVMVWDSIFKALQERVAVGRQGTPGTPVLSR